MAEKGWFDVTVALSAIGGTILVSGTAHDGPRPRVAGSARRHHDRHHRGCAGGSISVTVAVAGPRPMLGALSSQDATALTRIDALVGAAVANRPDAEPAAALSVTPVVEHQSVPQPSVPLGTVAAPFDTVLSSLSTGFAALSGGGCPALPPVPELPVPLPVP